MKQKYFITSAIILASLFCGSKALAQSQNISGCSVVHKQGKWYDSDYQNSHSRRDNTTNPDNFDEGVGNTAEQRGMKVHPYDNSIRIQKVHETTEIIYINDDETKTLTVPSTRASDYSSMNYYQRWYNYTTDGQIDTQYITPLGDGQRYTMSDGVYSGQIFHNEFNYRGNTDVYERELSRVRIVGLSTLTTTTPYRLACDMSDYQDIEFHRGNNNRLDGNDTFTEPTLGQRVIYEIYNADRIKDLINQNSYYEVHDIHYPNIRTSAKTPEQVSLDMPYNNYYVTGEDNNCGALTATIDYNGWANGDDYVYLVEAQNGSGNTGDVLNNGNAVEELSLSGEGRKIPFMMKGTIPDGKVIYINVTKNGYKIAQFKVTFDANTEPLTLSELKQINENSDQYKRTNKYLEDPENGFTKLGTLNFDFNTTDESNHTNGMNFYPYPLDWETSSYAFYAGNGNADNRYPQWGQYGLTTGNGYSGGNGLLNDTDYGVSSTYHLYVDANQYPGTICELPFNATFCRSSKLFVTAWVKSVNASQADANILFILRGNHADGTSEVIYTHASSQVDDTGEHPWYQIYFEFTSPSDYEFEKGYTLELFNNCAAATGADYCIDDIRVYLSPLQVNADISTPLCSTNSEAEVNVDINYGLLLNRLGIEEQSSEREGTNHTGYYSFVNKTVFDRLVASGTDYHEAFAQAVVHGIGVYQGSDANYFGRITFSDYFNSNDGQNGMVGSEGRGDNRRITFKANVAANNTEDGYVTLVAGDEYYIVFSQENITSVTTVSELAEFYEMDDQICGIRGTFTVNGPLIVNVDGEVSTDASTVCVGQIPLVDVQMSDGQGGVVEDAVFDWYFGSYAEFQEEMTEEIQTTLGSPERHGLAEALERFRINYPTATSIDANIVPVTRGDDPNLFLYQEDIDLLKKLNEDYSVEGLNPKLTLSASRNLQIRLMQTETYIVVIPVGTEPTDIGGGSQLAICWEPTQMLLHAQDGAPLMDVGRNDANYDGAGDYAVKIRIGKIQLDNLNQLQVPVRNPRLDSGEGTTVQAVSNDRNLYLNWTDDPRYLDQLVELGAFQKVVGSVNNFTVRSDVSADNMNVIVTPNRDTDFEPREGYQYNLGVRFTTTAVTEEDDCYGNLVIPMVVVPDYEIWIGGPNGNWNDDSNWRRAEPSELKKTSGYMTNEENGTSNGFVPLAATRVVIPTDKGVQLYEATQLVGAGGILDLEAHKGNLSDPTANIEYDLAAAYNQNLARFVAGLYATNQCYRIHFNVRGQMLNSHLLTYDRAWTNVEVPTEQWTTIATPLQGVFTGDWYTKSTGLESAEYFTDLTFGDGNDRLQPYVLQRSWNEHAVINEEGDGTESGHTSSAHTSDVTWSSTYNDVDIQNRPGEGFSILVGKGTQTTNSGKVEFRLPKEDTQYDGFNATFQRRQVNTGLLFSDNLKQAEKASVKVSPSHDGNYILVGNPFTASLDMNKFFEENTSLDKVYWTESSDPYTAVESNDQWITSDGSSTPLVPPYTAFYVRKTIPKPEPIDIVFSRDMAVMRLADDAETQNLQGMTLQATSEKGNSTALLRYDAMAENGFVNNEDVQLMTQSTGVTTPLVYTVAGDMAANINQIKDLQKIPLGLFAAENEVTTVTFKGVSALREPTLYDALQNSSTPITEGMTLNINGSSHGRYYIFALGEGDGTTTGIDEITSTEDEVKVTSPVHRQVMVSANSGIEGISIYSANGTLLRRVTPAGDTTCTIDGVASGVAVVMVKTANNNDTFKIIIK